MSVVAVTAANVGCPDRHARRRNYLAGVALVGGQSVYIDSNGVAQLCTSASAAVGQFGGITMPRMSTGSYAAGVGQAVEVVQYGEVEGFTLSGVAYWAPVYLADDGTYATTTGTKTVMVGKVVPSAERDSSGNPRKLLMVAVPFDNAAVS
jgi:hypothetical protein